MAVFYDTHAHLDYPDFQSDLSQVIERAQAAGIGKIISVGTDLESSRRAIANAERFPNVYAAAGWHPTHVMEAPDDIRAELRELAKHPKVVAIGETGLDFHHRSRPDVGGMPFDEEAYRRKQEQMFHQQMEVAAELGLNVIIHTRESFEAALTQLKNFPGKVRGVFHCFAEIPEAVRRVVELGSFVSFTGIATFKNGQNVRDSMAAAPLGKFMLETDCPFLAPVPFRGKRNEPAYVKEISEIAAQVKNCSLDELSAATCAAAHEFFWKMNR